MEESHLNQTMPQKGIYTGVIEKDEKNNYFCGQYLLDYQMVEANYKVGDWVTIKSIIDNPSRMSFEKYPKKSRNFNKANHKAE